jgi:hypothetical protein
MNEEEVELLRRVGQMALKRAMEECTRTGRVDPLVVGIQADMAITMMPCKWAADIMNNGRMKDVFFDALRMWVKQQKWRGIVIVTEAWMGNATEKGWKLMNEDMKTFREYSSEPGYKRAIADGIMEVSEVLFASAQSDAATVIITQPFKRNEATMTITYGEQGETVGGPDGLHGRQKMFGDLRKEWLR